MKTRMLIKKKIPSWQYDEFKHPGENFDVEAKFYDEKIQKIRDIQGEIRKIVGLLNIQPDQTVLDLGAGTGELTVAVAEHCSKVIAVELSISMLKLAEKKADAKGLKNIEFIQGGFLTYKHDKKSVDVVVSLLALHHLPDFWKQLALIRIFKIMKPEAKLLLYDTVYSFNLENYQEFFNRGISFLTDTVEKDTLDIMINHIKEEYSTVDWIMEGMIRRRLQNRKG